MHRKKLGFFHFTFSNGHDDMSLIQKKKEFNRRDTQLILN